MRGTREPWSGLDRPGLFHLLRDVAITNYPGQRFMSRDGMVIRQHKGIKNALAGPRNFPHALFFQVDQRGSRNFTQNFEALSREGLLGSRPMAFTVAKQ